MDEIKATMSQRLRRLGIALAIIACGVALRLGGYEIGLPYFLVKYGGSMLWGSMVFFLIAMLLPRQPIGRLTLLALVIAALTELTRLYHTAWLDEFRLTLQARFCSDVSSPGGISWPMASASPWQPSSKRVVSRFPASRQTSGSPPPCAWPVSAP